MTMTKLYFLKARPVTTVEVTQNYASNAAEMIGCDAKEVDIVMRVLQGVGIVILIGNMALVGYYVHQNKGPKTVRSDFTIAV